MKGTQSSCRLSGCTDLCILYERYTEFMQIIRVHKPVYIYEGYTEFMQAIRVHRLCTLSEGYTECMQTLSWNTQIHADPLGWYTDGILQSELTFFTQVALKGTGAAARARVQVESPTVVANLAAANCKQINRFYFPVAIRRYIFSLSTKR